MDDVRKGGVTMDAAPGRESYADRDLFAAIAWVVAWVMHAWRRWVLKVPRFEVDLDEDGNGFVRSGDHVDPENERHMQAFAATLSSTGVSVEQACKSVDSFARAMRDSIRVGKIPSPAVPEALADVIAGEVAKGMEFTDEDLEGRPNLRRAVEAYRARTDSTGAR